jgi:hypothetical protein
VTTAVFRLLLTGVVCATFHAGLCGAKTRLLTNDELRTGITLVGSSRKVQIEPDTSYYVDRGILKSARPGAGYWERAPKTSGVESRFYCLPVPDNPLTYLPVPRSQPWPECATVAQASFRSHWTTGYKLMTGDGWVVWPVYMLQGLAFGDNIFDVSPGFATSGTISTEDSVLHVTMEFRAPVFHFIRVAAQFNDAAFDSLYHASLDITCGARSTITTAFRLQSFSQKACPIR